MTRLCLPVSVVLFACSMSTDPDGRAAPVDQFSGRHRLEWGAYEITSMRGDSPDEYCRPDTFTGRRAQLTWRVMGGAALASVVPSFDEQVPTGFEPSRAFGGSLEEDGSADLRGVASPIPPTVDAVLVEPTQAHESLAIGSLQLSFDVTAETLRELTGTFSGELTCVRRDVSRIFEIQGVVELSQDVEGPGARLASVFAGSLVTPRFPVRLRGEVVPLSPMEPIQVVFSEPTAVASVRQVRVEDATGASVPVELSSDGRLLEGSETPTHLGRLNIHPLDRWTTDGTVSVVFSSVADESGNLTDEIRLEANVASGTERVVWQTIGTDIPECEGRACVGFESDPCGMTGGAILPPDDAPETLTFYRVTEESIVLDPSVEVTSLADPANPLPVTGPDANGAYQVAIPTGARTAGLRIEGVPSPCFAASGPFLPESIYAVLSE